MQGYQKNRAIGSQNWVRNQMDTEKLNKPGTKNNEDTKGKVMKNQEESRENPLEEESSITKGDRGNNDKWAEPLKAWEQSNPSKVIIQ